MYQVSGLSWHKAETVDTVEHTMLASVYNIAYIACGSAWLYIKTLYFFLTVLALSAAAIVANIKIRYDAKIPQLAIFGTRVIYVLQYLRTIRKPNWKANFS